MAVAETLLFGSDSAHLLSLTSPPLGVVVVGAHVAVLLLHTLDGDTVLHASWPPASRTIIQQIAQQSVSGSVEKQERLDVPLSATQTHKATQQREQ